MGNMKLVALLSMFAAGMSNIGASFAVTLRPQAPEPMPKMPQFSGRSRGKGRGTPERRYGNVGGKYMPHQGAKECARRVAFMRRNPHHHVAPF